MDTVSRVGQISATVVVSNQMIKNQLSKRLPLKLFDSDVQIPVFGELDTVIILREVDQLSADRSKINARLTLVIHADRSGILSAEADLLIYVHVRLIPNYPIKDQSPVRLEWIKTEIDQSSKTKLGFVSISDQTVLKAIESQRDNIINKIETLVHDNWRQIDLSSYLFNRPLGKTGLLLHAGIEELQIHDFDLSSLGVTSKISLLGKAYLSSNAIDIGQPSMPEIDLADLKEKGRFPAQISYRLDLLEDRILAFIQEEEQFKEFAISKVELVGDDKVLTIFLYGDIKGLKKIEVKTSWSLAETDFIFIESTEIKEVDTSWWKKGIVSVLKSRIASQIQSKVNTQLSELYHTWSERLKRGYEISIQELFYMQVEIDEIIIQDLDFNHQQVNTDVLLVNTRTQIKSLDLLPV